jgi:helix-turn-helix protein
LEEIRRVYDEHKGRYGSPRITQQLRNEGGGMWEESGSATDAWKWLSCSSEEGVSATDNYAGSRGGAQPQVSEKILNRHLASDGAVNFSDDVAGLIAGKKDEDGSDLGVLGMRPKTVCAELF